MAPPGPFNAGRSLKRRMRATVGRWLLDGGGQRRNVPYRVGEGQKVVRARLLRCGRHGQPQDLPPTGNRKRVSVLLAEVVTMWLRVGGQGAKNSCGVRIHVRQGGYR